MFRKWVLKDVIVLCVLGVAFGGLYLAGIGVWSIVSGLLGPIGLDMVYGIWFTAAITGAYIIRKPGVALAAELFAAIGELLLGTPAGIGVLIGAFVQGLGTELVFALTGWRKYSLPILMLGGVGASLTSFIYTYFTYGYFNFSLNLLLLMLGIRILSGAFLGGCLGKLIGDGLARTGVLHSFAISRDQQSKQVS